jgi:hypothetical protein
MTPSNNEEIINKAFEIADEKEECDTREIIKIALSLAEDESIFSKETVEDMIKMSYEKGKKKSLSDLQEKIEKIEAVGLDKGCKNIMLREISKIFQEANNSQQDTPRTPRGDGK